MFRCKKILKLKQNFRIFCNGTFLAYSKGNKRTLIDFRLYLPENWVEDKERCLKAKIPPEMIKFQTKHDLGLEMIDNAIKEEIPFSYVAMDGFYGENPELLTELENRGVTFVADIASNTQVYLEQYFTNWIRKSSIPITISNI